jgi:hypothetical protein
MSSSWEQCSCGLLFQQPFPGGCCPKCGHAKPSATPNPPRWFYARNNQKHGPVTLPQLHALLKSGQLQPADMVLEEGQQKWVVADSVKEFFTKVATVSAPSASSELPSPGRTRFLGILQSSGKWLLNECREIGVATWAQTARLVGYRRRMWRGSTLNKVARNADLALGQRLYEAGLGETSLRNRIAELDAKVCDARAAKVPTKALEAQRMALHLQLAAAGHAEVSPPAGVETEYAEAKVAHSMLQKQKSEMAAARAGLWPSGFGVWRRVGVGYVAVFCLIAFTLMMATGRRNASPDGGPADHAVARATNTEGGKKAPLPGEEPANIAAGKTPNPIGKPASALAPKPFTPAPTPFSTPNAGITIDTTFTGQTKTISCLCFSPDSHVLVSASRDGTLKLWDVPTGTPKTTLIGHAGIVHSIAYSQDGTVLASASDDKTVRLWEANSGKERSFFRGNGAPSCVRFIGQELLASSWSSGNGTVRIWNTRSGKDRVLLEVSGLLIHSISFSPDSKLLATAGATVSYIPHYPWAVFPTFQLVETC